MDNEQIENSSFDQEGIEPSTVDQTGLEGKIRISEDVISQLAIKALLSVEGIQPANPGLMANLRMGRKAANGVRISISDGDVPEIQVDTYVSVKYSLRIPDVCWDVQEAVKEQIERYTGYLVKSVNVYVQGITFTDKPAESSEPYTPDVTPPSSEIL
ncbi:MAG: Asp23/Gls24 family envelope stress response protein [Synergistaceae bacterium]|nr:Asp23/Gls24 family envelope stress response protein [Synergistaceae bacterium]